jgi:hypothetical protein
MMYEEEFADLKSQIVISSWGDTRKLPRAFTEQGVFSHTPNYLSSFLSLSFAFDLCVLCGFLSSALFVRGAVNNVFCLAKHPHSFIMSQKKKQLQFTFTTF